MFESHVSTDVMIVGGGMAGLMAANILTDKGIDCIVVEKGKSVGGRLATRRIGPGVADHGAQFFTVRQPEFQTYVDQWLEEELIYIWSHGWSDGSLAEPSFDGFPRYAAYGGMNALMKHLSKGVKDIRLNTRLVTATRDEEGWVFQGEESNIFVSKGLILTPPVPQGLVILEEGATNLQDDEMEALNKIKYGPSLTGMFWVEGTVRLPNPGAVQRRKSQISWLADNKQKGISPDATIITLQASDQYSKQMWSATDERIISALRTDLQLYMDSDATIREAQLKRWKYASPLTIHPERCLVAGENPALIFAGDAFGGPRTEGAALSGLTAGMKMLEFLG